MSSHHEQIKKLTETLEEWDYNIDRLEHRVKGLPTELRSLAQNKYQKLLDYRAELKSKEEQLLEASEQTVLDLEKTIDEYIDTFALLFKEVEMEVQVEGT